MRLCNIFLTLHLLLCCLALPMVVCLNRKERKSVKLDCQNKGGSIN